MSDSRANPRANHRVAYFNGHIVPEREVVLPFRDRGFKYGDAAFDMTRTFGGRPFRLKEHIERLYRSLRYLRIDPGLSQAEMIAASEEVLARNRHFLTQDTDYWLGQRVSRGVDAVGDEGWDHTGPNVIVECVPLPLKARARLFRDGIDIVVPPTRRVHPEALSPRAKTHNYLNLITADLEAKAQDKEAWSVLLDAEGHLAEGIGSNIFLVRDGAVMTPRARWVLPGISRQMVIDLCGEGGITCDEADLDLYRLDQERVYWFANLKSASGKHDPNPGHTLRAEFGDWHKPIPEIINSAQDAPILRHDIYDRKPAKKWGAGRISLLGDAAHPMAPDLGQGACQAIEDSVVLARCLNGARDPVAALREYERRRWRRVSGIARRSYFQAWIGQQTSPSACRIRNFLMKVAPAAFMERAYKINVMFEI